MMLSLDTAYRSFGGEVEASSTPTICRLSDSRRHQLWAIAHGRNQGHRRTGVRRLHRELRAEIREGGGLLEPGSRRAAGVLRLPGRALETPADDQSHCKHLR